MSDNPIEALGIEVRTDCRLRPHQFLLRARAAAQGYYSGSQHEGRVCSDEVPCDAHFVHKVATIWQERPGEVSWRCTCGAVSKHQRLDNTASVAVPKCFEED